jgi:hypothetical protein
MTALVGRLGLALECPTPAVFRVLRVFSGIRPVKAAWRL